MKKSQKQAGAELGQAQVKLEVLVYFGVKDDAEFVVEDAWFTTFSVGWWVVGGCVRWE